MLVYKRQLIRLKTYDEPAVVLGWDEVQDDKLWVVRLVNREPKQDYFYTGSLDYFYKDSKNPATKEGYEIIFGDLVDNTYPCPLFVGTNNRNEVSPEELKECGEYLNSIFDTYSNLEKK